MTRRAVVVTLVLLGLALGGVAHAADAKQQPRHYVVIVANATSLDATVEALEYADEDAARYAELYDQIADHVDLLAVLDADGQRVYPDLVARAGVPDRKTLLRTLKTTFAAMQADRDAGRTVELTFVLIGHGDVGAGGEGYVALLDGPFTRTDLYQEVLERSPADINNVIIDACNSYFLVHRRGGKNAQAGDDAAPSHAAAVKAYVGELDLTKFPNTGVLLSTSAAKESYEWSAFGAGVFSHEVRSALAGAADANADGRVDYAEVAAFVAAANLHVNDARARVEMFVHAPARDLGHALVDLSVSRFKNWISLPEGKAFRFFLEDDRGARYADVNASGERPAYLALVPRSHYYVREADGPKERRLDLSVDGTIEVARGSLRKADGKRNARGSVDEGFRRNLFDEPFGPTFLAGYAAANKYQTAGEPAQPWTPPAGQIGACLTGVARQAATRGIAVADAPALAAALADADCAGARAAAEAVLVDASFVDRKVRRLNERALRAPSLASGLRGAVREVATRLVAGDYEGAALLLADVEAHAEAL